MLDLKMIRTEPDKVKAAIQKREMNLDSVIDEILKIDVDRRAVTGKVEAKKAEQNAASKQIPAMKLSLIHIFIERILSEKEDKPKNKKRIIVKDIRIFMNTISHAVKTMQLSGIQAKTIRNETDDYIECIVRIPKTGPAAGRMTPPPEKQAAVPEAAQPPVPSMESNPEDKPVSRIAG